MNALSNVGCRLLIAACGVIGALGTAWSDDALNEDASPNTEWTWTKSGTTVTLTEVLPADAPDGSVAWAFTLSDTGVLKKKTDGTSPALNFRTIPEDCPYAIVTLADSFLASNKTIEEVYFPDTLKKLSNMAFWNSPNLRICDFTSNSQLERICYCAVCTYKKTVQIRVTDNLKWLEDGSLDYATLLFDNCPVFPDGLTYFGSDNKVNTSERVVFGGDDSHDITWGSGTYAFRQCTAVKEVVFGAGVTGCKQQNFLYQGGTITNVVCRCPTGFAFASGFGLYATKVSQYDFYGWPSGAPTMSGTGTRLLVPRDNLTWKALVGDPSRVKPWVSLTSAEQKVYTDAFGSELEPFGKMAAKTTYEGFTIGSGVWIVFNKGEDIRAVSLTVSGEAGDYAPAEGEPAFSPAYGTIPDVVSELGEKFTCTAPRYIGSDLICYEVTGYRLYGKDETGSFTVVKSEGAFTDDEPRAFEFDTAVQTEDAYKLLWLTGNKAGFRFAVSAPLWSDLGTWVTNTVPGFKGYFAAGTEATLTATGAEGHPFVMWAIAEDGANATRYDATLTLTMTNTWTVQPVFKTDCWKFTATSVSGNTYGGWLCDGYFNLNSSLSKSMRRLTLYGDNSAQNNTYSYAEELDFSKPVYFTDGSGADGQEVYLVNIPSRAVLERYLARFRKISIGRSVESLASICLWGNPQLGASAKNLRELVFDGEPTAESLCIATCGNVRQITYRGGIPTFANGTLNGLIKYAVRLTVSHTNEEWLAFSENASNVTRWRKCTAEQKEAFETYHPGERHPYGLVIKGGDKYVPANQWLDFDMRPGLMLLVR